LVDLRQGVTRHIRLCANSAAINQFLPLLLARYAREQRQVRVELDAAVQRCGHGAARG
jgi:DNA-binding transcriptional LysR family regulator